MIINNIKEFRRLKRLSLRQLSDMTGISKAALNSFERGITSPTLEHLMPIAAAFRIEVKDLFYETSLSDLGGDEMEEDLKRIIINKVEELTDFKKLKLIFIYIVNLVQ